MNLTLHPTAVLTQLHLCPLRFQIHFSFQELFDVLSLYGLANVTLKVLFFPFRCVSISFSKLYWKTPEIKLFFMTLKIELCVFFCVFSDVLIVFGPFRFIIWYIFSASQLIMKLEQLFWSFSFFFRMIFSHRYIIARMDTHCYAAGFN